ncbi:MAG: CotH kinase family protein [Deltaproteobacteria bacterium]|nr:CotH kinase family protein [Deltaproteobacteria bacterium]
MSDDRSQLEALVPVMQLPDDQLLAALEPHLDVDAFLDFWITELIISHADGYARNTNNFYLYFDPDTGRMNFIPWGIDSIFHVGNRAAPWEERPPPEILWEEGVLAHRLYRHPTMGPLYLERLPLLLDALWDEDALLARANEYHALLSPYVVDANREAFEGEVDRVRYFIRSRRDALQNALARPPPVTDDLLRDPWCVDQIGTVQATFATTWGNLAEQDPFAAGTGTLTLDPAVDPTLPPITRVGSKSGYDEQGRQNVIQVVTWHDPNIALVLNLTVANPADLAPGMSLPLDWLESSGHIFKVIFQPGADPEVSILGLVGDGVLYLHEAGTEAGDGVVGTVDALVYESIW